MEQQKYGVYARVYINGNPPRGSTLVGQRAYDTREDAEAECRRITEWRMGRDTGSSIDYEYSVRAIATN